MKQEFNQIAVLCFALVFCGYAIFWSVPNDSFTIDKMFGAFKDNGKKDEYAVFVGDIMLARDVERKISAFDIDPFEHIKPFLNQASVVIGNFEASVPSKHQPTPDGSTVFSVKQEMLTLLYQAGFTHLSLANNHSLDHGLKAFQNTMYKLEQIDLTTFGNQKEIDHKTSIAYFELNNEKVSLIGLNTVNNQLPDTEIKQILDTANQNSRHQIAFLHWGEEYTDTPNDQQVKLAKLLIDNGVDAVVGAHPHVVQQISYYKDVPIFYSLGNFVFDQYFSTEVQQGLVLKMKIVRNKLSFEAIPITSIGSLIQPRFMEAKKSQEFLSQFLEEENLYLVSQ